MGFNKKNEVSGMKTNAIMTGIVCLFILISTANAQFAGGSGTEEDPYQVGTLEQLQEVNNHLDKFFIQTADIDAADTQNWNDGEGFLPIGSEFPFSGTFDGSGHVIENLYIFREMNSIGLFREFAGVVRNVTLIDVDVTGNNQVGALVGRNEGGQVFNSSATGNVTGGRRVGGLVGNNDPGQIFDSHAACMVVGERDVGGLVGDNRSGSLVKASYATGSVYTFVEDGHDVGGLAGANRGGEIHDSYATGFISAGGGRVGGLVGQNQNDGVIANSYALSDVSGAEIVGGLVGRNRASLRTSYSTGQVFADDEEHAGGFLGSNVQEGNVETSYWDTEGSGFSKGVGEDPGIDDPSNFEGFAGLTTAQMSGTAALDNMAGFDFDEIWAVVDGDYPTLAWALKDPTDAGEVIPEIPNEMVLEQNYPNPFNPMTRIAYTIPVEGAVSLEVYNVIGQRVAVLVNERQAAGRHHISFDATSLSSGVYIYRLTSMGETITRQMLFVK